MWLMMAAALLQAGATGAPRPGQAVTAPDSQPDRDIVVEGYGKRKDLPTSVDAPAAVSAVRHRQSYEFAERLAKCAARSKLAGTRRLRAVVDGEFNSASHALAQDRLKRIYITCGQDWAVGSFSTAEAPPMTLNQAGAIGGLDGAPVSSDPAPLGHSIYDRGAFMIEAMRRYAPDLTLTKAETADANVQQRFVLREFPRNRYRLPLDRAYFRVASCMVRLEPELAVRFVMGREGPALNDDLQAAIINRSRACVGGAKRVEVDATQFRIYIADALYRWAVAARNVGSLIPAGDR